MRKSIVLACMAVASLAGCHPTSDDECTKSDNENPTSDNVRPMPDGGLPPNAEQARDGAVREIQWWLVTHQADDGSWRDGPSPVTSTALVLNAFMSHGDTPAYCKEPKFKDSFITAFDYMMKSVAVTNGIAFIDGADKDARVLPIVTKTFCDAYGLTRNPDLKEYAIACLRRTVEDANARCVEGSWSGGEELLDWTEMALRSGKWALKDNFEGIEECLSKVSVLAWRMESTGYCESVRRYLAGMRRGASEEDRRSYVEWRGGQRSRTFDRLRVEPGFAFGVDGESRPHRRCFVEGGVYDAPSGFGVSADCALAIMDHMIGGGGMRNLPSFETSPRDATPDTNGEGVSIDI